MSEKKVKLTNGVEYKELYNSLEEKILKWEKQNNGNAYFCKLTGPYVKDLNDSAPDGTVLLQDAKTEDFYRLEDVTEGRCLDYIDNINSFRLKDIAGIAYEKAGTGRIVLKVDGTLVSNYDNDYINNIHNAKEAAIIDSTLIVLNQDNELVFHDYWDECKYFSIDNCKRFLILNPLSPLENMKTTQYIFVLHDEVLSIYSRKMSFGSVEPVLCGEFKGVENIFTSPDGDTICVRFTDGRLKTFGEHIFDSAIDFDGAIMYYYGPLLEDGTMKLQDKYSRDDYADDERNVYSGIFGLQKNGKCFVLSDQNWFIDKYWHLSTNALLKMEATEDIIDIAPTRFLYLNKNRELRSFEYSIHYDDVANFSSALYHEVCVHSTGAIEGTKEAKYGCCKFDGIEDVKKALAFSMGTVVFTADGKLKSLCNKNSERAYDKLPIYSGVKDIFRNYSIFAILCKNGDLYTCNTQKAVYYDSEFEQKPFTAWQLIMKGVERLEHCGEETFAILGADAEIPTKQDKPTSENIKPQVTEEPAFDDFKIVKGVLKKYTGSGGDVVIPNCITKIGRDAFSDDFWGKNPSITSVIIPQGIKSVDDCAFSGCTNLIKVSIPEGVTKIGEYAFSICKSLEAVVIPNSVIKIGENAFSGCESLKEIIFPFDLTEISENAFSSCFSLVNIVIPSNVKRIGDSAFSNCKNLENVVIQEGVKKLGMSAFSLCQKLKTITIPKTVKEIDWNAFAYCENLTIHAPAGSYAEQYAKENRIPFIAE